MELKWLENSLFVDVMDQYLIWRLNDLIEYDLDPQGKKGLLYPESLYGSAVRGRR